MTQRASSKSKSTGKSAGSGSAATTETRQAASREFALAVARHAANTRCTNVVVLDLRNLSPVCDYFVIATGTSARQMRTVADEIAGLAKQSHFSPLSSSGLEGETWILVDCVDVVFHAFNVEARSFYDLDNLWGDAKVVPWQP